MARKKLNSEKLEKIDKKYGNEALKKIAHDNNVGSYYYEVYLASRRQAHIDNNVAMTFVIVSFVCFALSFLTVVTLLPAYMSLFISVVASMDGRIERLWASNSVHDICCVSNQDALDKRLRKLEEGDSREVKM